jgi:hypothetical protein
MFSQLDKIDDELQDDYTDVRRNAYMLESGVGPKSGRLESEFAELEKLAGEHELPREVLQAMHHLVRQQGTLGLSEQQLRERLNQLQELHILPEHRVQPDADSDGEAETSGKN